MSWQAWSGWFGVAFFVLEAVGVGLFIAAGTPPSIADSAKFSDYVAQNSGAILTFAILNIVAVCLAYVWLLGLKGIIESDSEYGWAGTLTFGVGLVAGALAIVATGLIAAAALEAGARTGAGGANVVSGLFVASGLVFGVASEPPTALFIAAAAYAVTRTGVLPRWTGWVGYLAALLNLAAVPAVYGGREPGGFYTATGFVGLFFGLLPFAIWVLVTSIGMIRMPPSRAA